MDTSKPSTPSPVPAVFSTSQLVGMALLLNKFYWSIDEVMELLDEAHQ